MTRGAVRRPIRQVSALLAAVLMLSGCGTWHGIANVPLRGGPGRGLGSYTVYVQVPDTLALNTNSKVLVADVPAGQVRAIGLRNWVATLTVELGKDVKLPRNAAAKIGQTSLLGSQHVELAAPDNPSTQRLANGDTISLQNSSAYPTVERTMAGVALVLRGGGVADLETISNQVHNVLGGRADAIHDFLGKLDTFTAQLDEQSADITHAIDSADRLAAHLAKRADVLDRLLPEVAPVVKHLNGQQQLLVDAVDALGRVTQSADNSLGPVRGDLHQDLQSLQCPLRELGKAAPSAPTALEMLFTQPFPMRAVGQSIRGDAINFDWTIDLTFAGLDNALLVGTGLSGALRALEQSFGHNMEDPMTIPDVRYTPNAATAPGGPYVERADRNC